MLTTGELNIPGHKYLFADDFLVLCRRSEASMIKHLISEKLNLIGLSLSMEPGKCADIEEKDVWLGFCVSLDGLNIEDQINRNLKKAATQAAMLRTGGIFKNRLDTRIIISVWRCRITPVLGY